VAVGEVGGDRICKGLYQRMQVWLDSLARIVGCKPVPLPWLRS